MSDIDPMSPTNSGANEHPTLSSSEMMETIQRMQQQINDLSAQRQPSTPAPPSTPRSTAEDLIHMLTNTLSTSAGKTHIHTVDKPKHFDGAMGEAVDDFVT